MNDKSDQFRGFPRRAWQNPAVKAAYDAMENEFALSSALISAHVDAGLSQAETAERMGITMAARVESVRRVSLAMIQRYATVVGRTITITIHPT